MNISIGFSGPAGGGVNKAGLMLARLLANKGYNVLVDKEYASVIKGDNNLMVVYISDTKLYISKKIDYFICFDDYSIQKNQKIYGFSKVINLKDKTWKYKNVPAFGCALKLLGIDVSQGEDIVKSEFEGKTSLDDNLNLLREGFDLQADKVLDLSEDIGIPKKMYFGNEIIGKGAMASGLGRYSAYPMTPASSIIDVITGGNNDVIFFQGEDEIAVAMSMLGAKFAGKRAMCGTSGGGFALMTESISFSNQAEIGGVYVLSQRDGPSTGTPTFTGQGDLDYALNASFGETYPIVVTPDTFECGYNLIGKALNRSDKYQHPIIYLVDKQYSESYISLDESSLKAEEILKLEDVNLANDDYKRYQDTVDGISPYVVPGTQKGEFIASSYEHDEYGATSEDPETKTKMMDKRKRKLDTFVSSEFMDDFYGYEIINPDADKFFVSFGFNRYLLQDYINGKDNIGLIVIKVLQPLDPRLKKWFVDHDKQIKNLTFVELNQNGSLEHLIVNECNLKSESREKRISHIRKYNLYPFFEEDIK